MHTTTPPAQQATSSTTPLTIDTKRLGDLWLPSEKKEREALDYMNSLCLENFDKKNYTHLHLARTALQIDYSKTVQTIAERGGLLLIGGAA